MGISTKILFVNTKSECKHAYTKNAKLKIIMSATNTKNPNTHTAYIPHGKTQRRRKMNEKILGFAKHVGMRTEHKANVFRIKAF